MICGVADVFHHPPLRFRRGDAEIGHVAMKRTQLEQDELRDMRARVQNAEAAAIRLLMEKDQWHDSARVAEAELARQRPVVDAAEALVEYHEKPPPRLDRAGINAWLIPREDLIEDLAEKVRETQR